MKEAEDNRNAASCPVSAGTVTDAKLDADQKNFEDLKHKLDGAAGELRDARTNLLLAYKALDDWYKCSSVSTVLILPPVSKNSLTRLVIQVSDLWVPLAPGAMNIASVKPPTKAKKPTSTTITIDRTDSKKSTITIGSGAGAAASATVTDDSKKGTVIIGGTLNAGSTVTATVTDDPTKPVATVQVTQAASPAAASTNNTAGPAVTIAPTTTAAQNSSTASPTAPTPDKAVVAASSVPNATYLLARHRFVNFVPTGGLLVSRFSSPTYNIETLSLTTNTTTVTSYSPTTSSGTAGTCPPPMSDRRLPSADCYHHVDELYRKLCLRQP